jgi:hypothetical protein
MGALAELWQIGVDLKAKEDLLAPAADPYIPHALHTTPNQGKGWKGLGHESNTWEAA